MNQSETIPAELGATVISKPGSQMGEHTPGPWEIEPNVARGAWIGRKTESEIEWAALACGNDDATARANARLIAAAPDLLAALAPFANVRIERATEWSEQNEPWPDDRPLVGFDGWHLTVGMVRAVRAAIAKATAAR